jgi:NtrC-family two-component system response regulator AlgB
MTRNSDDKYAPLSVLIVDDEANIRKTLSYCLVAEEHSVIAVSNPADALEEARRRSFDLAFVDLKLGDEDGMELIPLLLSDSPWTKIVVITAYASIESAVEAIRRGATDYIAKPFTPDQVKLVTRKIGRVRELETEIAVLRENVQRLGPEGNLQSKNPSMQRVVETARRAALSEAIVLLQGESGTGKSVFARAIHQWSPRAAKAMAIGAHRGLRGWHSSLGRDRGYGPFGSGQVVALHPGQGVRAPRRFDATEGRCAHHSCNECRH